jgi:hypothetical protein
MSRKGGIVTEEWKNFLKLEDYRIDTEDKMCYFNKERGRGLRWNLLQDHN